MSILQEKLPPTLRDSSPVANGVALTRDPLAFFVRLSREAGDFAHYILSDGLVYFVNDPRLVREVLLLFEADFAKWAFNDSFRLVFGTGLIGSIGELHRRMRKVAHPPLQPSVVPRYANIIVDLAHKQLSTWRAGEIDVSLHMSQLTLNAVATALFSMSLGQRVDMIREATSTMMRLSTKLGGAPQDVGAFDHANESVSLIAQQIHDEGAARPNDTGDLLSLLIAAERAGIMSGAQLRQEIRTFLLAGHATTAQSIACAFWLLARNPDAQAKLQNEIDSVVGQATPSLEHVPRLKYCEAVFLEVLRLYPPVWVFGREALNDVTLDGITIKEGQELVICTWLLHRNEQFFPEPEKFRPERWLDDLRARLPRGTYLPFSTGARNCIGEHFAMLEATLVLASALQKWTFRELPGSPDPGWSAQLLYWPRRGIKLEVEARA